LYLTFIYLLAGQLNKLFVNFYHFLKGCSVRQATTDQILQVNPDHSASESGSQICECCCILCCLW